jgi:phosphoacetylglucosamine mutase
LAVPDKSLLKCSDDETYLVEPKSLQDALNVAMTSVNNGRCFVRPSGTEDVVRIYAEAATVEEVEKLTELSREAILTFYGKR